ncbi:hypothetical protein [Campylobacter sp. CCS1377]|uniref:Uncharacterized protein n=1 Tax=Campylobacter sp. CCS1377 TaxID=3158229 RepID=A0AAU7E8J6_9BACT|nr:hypothetical protein [Campylobacter jejuni]
MAKSSNRDLIFEDDWDFKDDMVAKVFTGKEIKFINTKGEFVE